MAISPLPTQADNIPTYLASVARAVNRLIGGESNATGSLTLAVSTTTTTVYDQRIGPNRTVFLQPTTANAAAALGTTYIDPAEVGVAQFKVRHANNSQTDRTFRYEIRG